MFGELELMAEFLSYYPLKQGLKPQGIRKKRKKNSIFLSYYPLKQGLKQNARLDIYESLTIFILLSIKTRIETPSIPRFHIVIVNFYPTIH